MTVALEDWAELMRRFGDEAAGMLTLDVVRRRDMPGLLADALAGDAEAAWLLLAVRRCLAGIRDAPADAPMECAHCCKPLRGGHYAICIIRPGTADPIHQLGQAICLHCGPTVRAIQAVVLAALQRYWPDLQQATVTHPKGGRA